MQDGYAEDATSLSEKMVFISIVDATGSSIMSVANIKMSSFLKREKKVEEFQLKKIELAKMIVKSLEHQNKVAEAIVDQNKEIIRLLEQIAKR